MTTIPARDFCLAVSMSDLVTWFGDGDDDFSENEALKAALSALGVTVDLRALYVSYFERTSVGTGDVHVYQPAENSKNVFAVDLYRDLTDQMDIVSFAVGCDEHCLPIVRDKLRSFFDGASCQVHYEEANYLPRLRSMIDAETYPFIIDESGYKQQFHRTYG
ncbi:hypothetical protein FDZ73_20235 [bacterium]|nr:MAG: hypothetical protein FDZ73_20235 [bacterium]